MAVAVVKTDRAEDVRKAVELLGGMGRFVGAGEKVVVKPNICIGKGSETGAVTDPAMVAEVCRMVAECGGEPVVAESPIYPFKSSRAFPRAGYGDFQKRYGFSLIDIDASPGRTIKVPLGRAISHSVVSDEVLGCDRLINMPVLKTHLQTVFTVGLKNLKGVVPGKQKHIIHLQGLDQGIVDINTVVRSDLTIVDGIIGMEGTGGPTNGRPVRMNVILAGDNVVETDAAAARVMGGDPLKVEHIRLASEQGLGPLDPDVLGDPLVSVTAARELPRMPSVNKFFITGVGIKVVDLLRRPWVRLTGGERIETKVELGELVIDYGLCDGCRVCLKACPVQALSFDRELNCDRSICIRCFCCAEACDRGALGKRFE